MITRDIIQLGLFLGILALASPPLGIYLRRVFDGERAFLHPILGPVERFLYQAAGIDPNREQAWGRYALCLLVFSAAGFVLTLVILLCQGSLPLNPQGFEGLSWDLALNTAVSFLTNTNWQAYGGESTMSYFSQMVALTFQNFISAAVGLAAGVAVIRGLARREASGVGNFWADVVRANLYVLLPLSLILAIFLVSQGMIQNFSPYREVATLEGGKQIIAQGPVASQVAVKMLGVNGGGFFNANAAHPYENPTPLSNFLQMLAIFIIPSGLVFLLGEKLGHPRHAWSVWAAMAAVFLVGVLACAHFEYQGDPRLTELGCASAANMEGKEVRFGVFSSALFATVTTDASCGAVNAMHDSFTPLGGLVPLVNMQLGEVVFGGVGSGLYGMILFIVLTVFIAGLMVGRTPDYLGKKIEAREVQLAIIALILTALSVLCFSAWASLAEWGTSALANPAAHGFSEILCAYTSGSQNNGSAFAGLSANVPQWNLTLAAAMLVGRFGVMLPMLAVAGSLAAKKPRLVSEASFPVHGPTFVVLLLGVIVIVGALTFLPALSLGPIVEHFQMLAGQLF